MITGKNKIQNSQIQNITLVRKLDFRTQFHQSLLLAFHKDFQMDSQRKKQNQQVVEDLPKNLVRFVVHQVKIKSLPSMLRTTKVTK